MKSNSIDYRIIATNFAIVLLLLLVLSSSLFVFPSSNDMSLAQAKKKKSFRTSSSESSSSLSPHEAKDQQGISNSNAYTDNNSNNGANNNNDKVVIITFGDGLQSQYTYAKPILDKYGFKANFFVTCNKVGLTDSKITWQELVQLYKDGHVIGSKTVDYGTKAFGHEDLNHLSANK